MRVELPEGYEPPLPTHPDYGYLTPAERAARAERDAEAQEAVARSGADDAGTPGEDAAAPVEERSPWGPPPVVSEPAPEPILEALEVGAPERQSDPEPDPARAEVPERAEVVEPRPQPAPEPDLVLPHTPEVAEITPAEPVDPERPALPAAEGGDAARPRAAGWVPEAPAPRPAPAQPRSVLASVGEMRWDAYRQEWVQAPAPAAPTVAEAAAEPPPDVAAAAGGRRASSSWTSTEGRRYRWEARAQRWVVEEPAGP